MHCQDTKFAFLIIASEIQKRRLEHFEGFEPSSRQLTRVIGFIFSELCLPLFLGLQYCVFQEKYIILDILVGDDVVETSLPRYQHGVITVIRIAYTIKTRCMRILAYIGFEPMSLALLLAF